MDRFRIRGGRALHGTVAISSSKNAALPILAACLLAEEPCTIKNVPALGDVRTMLAMLTALGARVTATGRSVTIDASRALTTTAPYEIVRTMRASYYVLGPLLGRMGKARVALPGGCAIGPRPIDLHLQGMERLGARVRVEHGYVVADTAGLVGCEILLEGQKGSSVGATCNVMMAACRARGRTVLRGAACEPEVVDLANFLVRLGARIEGAGTPTVFVRGVSSLGGTTYTPIPDRIETGTMACAAFITRGDLELTRCLPGQCTVVFDKLTEAGAEIETTLTTARVRATDRPRPVAVITSPYPGFPTDMQAQFMALLSLGSGTSAITETIFENRFLHALELARMGAQINLQGNTAVIRGVERLTGAEVMGSDLRAAAALVLAGLAAEGETVVSRVYHLDRGYEKLETRLNRLGAEVVREPGED